MSVIKNIIRGGQTNLHGVRMSIQIVRSALLASMIIGMLYFCVQCYSVIPSSAWGQYFEFQVAKMTQSIVPDEVQIKKTEQLYYPVRGKPYKRKILSIINDSSLKLISRLLEKSLESLVIESSKVSLGVFVLIILFWGLKGYIGKQKKHKRGIEIVELSKLKWRLRLNQLSSDIKLGSLPLVKNSETSHILIAGTTGAGKSNCFNLLFSQVRKKGQKSIIYDPTGEYVAKFYRKDKDKLLNPFDARSENWNIWSEFSMQYELEKIASALIPDSKANDPFWIESARALFVYGALDFYENKRTSSRDFVAEILGEDSDRLRSKLSNTPIAPMLDKENNKQLLSVKSTLMTYIRCFEYLENIDKDKKSFSISKWIAKEDDSCLFREYSNNCVI